MTSASVDLVQAFGQWDAPVTDDAVWIEPPIGEKCAYCRERIRAGENGAITPNGFVQHRECSLRAVLGGIGHHVNHAHYCGGELGPDAGLSYRASALLVWRTFHGSFIGEAELDRLRSSEPGEGNK